MIESRDFIEVVDSEQSKYFSDYEDPPLSGDTHKKRQRALYWQKWAYHNKGEKDDFKFLELEETHLYREVIHNFEKNRIKFEISFRDLNPPNTGVTKWVEKSLFQYPDVDPENVENLIDTFRSHLKSRSREQHKNIVIVLILENLFLVAHCKSNIGIVEANDKVFIANELLNSNNVFRADIIKNENGKLTFSAYERTKHWSKGHAELWGIEPDAISWDQLGPINLFVELERFSYKIQIPVDLDQFRELIRSKSVEPSGTIYVGEGKGTITEVKLFNKKILFKIFYNDCVLYEEKLNLYSHEFKKLLHIGENQKIIEYTEVQDKYLYTENIKSLIDNRDEKEVLEKKHPYFTICFSTDRSPGICPTPDFVDLIYEGFFCNKSVDLYHAGVDFVTTPITIGAVNLYHQIIVPCDYLRISEEMICLIQDARSKKISHILEYVFCEFWKANCSKSLHLKSLFNFVIKKRILESINFEFKNNGILETEKMVDYKSSDDFDPKINQFIKNTLVPTIEKYHKKGILSRCAIIYGIEDNGEIVPCLRLKSDMVSDIEKKTNEMLSTAGVKIVANSIPFQTGNLLLILLIPDIH